MIVEALLFSWFVPGRVKKKESDEDGEL